MSSKFNKWLFYWCCFVIGKCHKRPTELPQLRQAARQEADQTLRQFAETEAAWDASKTFLTDAEPPV
jgi:hypothetical protein